MWCFWSPSPSRSTFRRWCCGCPSTSFRSRWVASSRRRARVTSARNDWAFETYRQPNCCLLDCFVASLLAMTIMSPPSLLCMFTNSLIESTLWEDSMRDNSFDRTIERNYIQKWRFLIAEYEEVKAGRSPTFKRVGDFYRHHGTCSQTFRKYYNRYLRSGAEADLLPQRRGPKWRERREPEGIDADIVALRKRGMNRYEIHAALRERRDTVPSPSTIYRVLQRYQLNRRTPA